MKCKICPAEATHHYDNHGICLCDTHYDRIKTLMKGEQQ